MSEARDNVQWGRRQTAGNPKAEGRNPKPIQVVGKCHELLKIELLQVDWLSKEHLCGRSTNYDPTGSLCSGFNLIPGRLSEGRLSRHRDD